MSFLFNFADESSHSDSQSHAVEAFDRVVNVNTESSEHHVTSKELMVDWETVQTDVSEEHKEFHVTDGTVLTFKSAADAGSEISAHANDGSVVVAQAIAANTDLIPNIYEGGLQVWECSLDLTCYVASSEIPFATLKVLELGCGAGLPGIYALTKGATVDFQDYNEEVLKAVTVPNVAVNARRHATWPPKSRFFAGDWASLGNVITDDKECSKYDVILTSETVYSCDSYGKLHSAMDWLLGLHGVVWFMRSLRKIADDNHLVYLLDMTGMLE